jgi:sulfur carrier protein
MTPVPVRVWVNGEPAELPAGATVSDVVTGLCASPRGVAVALGREVIPRSAWTETVVAEGDRIEIVTAAAGG